MLRTCQLAALALVASLGAADAALPADGTFGRVLTDYGVLRTVAGSGADDDLNDWRPFMEGGSALQADLSRPHMTTADAFGNLYVADKEAHAIRKIRPDGSIVTWVGVTPGGVDLGGFNGDGPGTSVQLNNPNGLFTFPDGTCYILDMDNDRIRRVDPSGLVETVVADPIEILVGRGLWVSPDERTIFYASGDRVRRWTAEQGLSTYASGFGELGNIDVDRDGHLVVTDRLESRVWRLFDDGSRVLIAGNGLASGGGDGAPAVSTGLDQVRSVAFDDHGGFFLCTHEGGDVWYVDRDGIIHLLITGEGRGNNVEGDGLPVSQGRFSPKISEPRAVSLAPNGDLLITTNDRGYIRIVENLRPAPVPTLTRFDHDPITGTTLGWAGDPRHVYDVERAPAPDGPWTRVHSRLGDRLGGEMVFVDAGSAGIPARFFRVVANEAP